MEIYAALKTPVAVIELWGKESLERWPMSVSENGDTPYGRRLGRTVFPSAFLRKPSIGCRTQFQTFAKLTAASSNTSLLNSSDVCQPWFSKGRVVNIYYWACSPIT